LAVLFVTGLLRNRLQFFALALAVVGLLPVIFLSNHRFAFYWYLPSIGVWLWFGLLAGHFRGLLARLWPRQQQPLTIGLFFVLLGSAVLSRDEERRQALNNTGSTRGEFLAYIAYVRSLPLPGPDGVVKGRGTRMLSDDGVERLYYLTHDKQRARLQLEAPPRR
jgi:hypothetical protein